MFKGTKYFMEGIFLFLAVTALGTWGCKKGGPTVPYNSLAPAVSGNTTVNAVDNSRPVSGLAIDVLEPNGTTLTGMTGSNGTWTFDYNYAAETVSAPMTVVSLPQTVINGGYTFVYGLSASIVPPGTSSVPLTCASATTGNTLTLEPEGNTLYGYALTTNLIYNTTYDVPGSLNVPVSFYSPNIPYGWEISGPSSLLQGVSQTIPVTLSVPAYQYQTFSDASPLTIETMDFGNPSNDRGQAEIPISRNFAVSVYVASNVDYDLINQVTNGHGAVTAVDYQFSGNYTVIENIPVNVNWTGSYALAMTVTTNAQTFVQNITSQSVNATGDYDTIDWQAPATQLGYFGFGSGVTASMYCAVTISAPGLGTYQTTYNYGQIALDASHNEGGIYTGTNTLLYTFYNATQSF